METLTFYEFNANPLRVYGDASAPWFMAKDICKCLGYKNVSDTLKKNVSEENQSSMKVADKGISGGYTLPEKNVQPESRLVNEAGLFELVLRSKKAEAKVFQKWVTGTVLPSIRKSGSYSVSVTNLNRKCEIECLEIIARVLLDCGAEDRDRLMIRDLLRSYAITDKNQYTDIQIAYKEYSLSRRLSEKFGLRGREIDRGLCKFGRIVASKYRELHDENDPPRRQQFVDGTVRNVFNYLESDYLGFIDDLIRKHFAYHIRKLEDTSEARSLEDE